MTRVSTVLVADPSANARAETQRVLQAAGYRVVGCALGEELLRLLDQEPPQMVVLEPVPEGWDQKAGKRR